MRKRLPSPFLALAFALPQSRPASAPAAPKADAIVFTEVDPAAAGIDFVKRHGGSGQKFVAETMGSGVALFDADGDGDLDVYLLQGAPLPGTVKPGDPPFDARSRFYKNEGAWKFRDATDASGLANAGYAMGVATGDVDNDGDLDVYVSAYGRGHLFLNRGDATFEDVTEASGVRAEAFLASAAFGDVDNDGLVDLYVTNYLDYAEAQKNPYCGKHEPGGRAYCSPHAFSGAPDFLYKNLGGARFEDVSKQTGVARAGRFDGKGLGVVMSDFDDDGDVDIAVANDSCANFLYRNDGGWKLVEIAARAGVAFAEDGRERAGMGIDAADVDGDRRPDLFITNLDAEPNSLFLNRGKMSFSDASGPSGLGPPSIPYVGFGCGLVDLDGDGDRDALVANGHILDNADLFGDLSTYRERPLAFENDGSGRFRLLPRRPGFLDTPRVLRGLAFGDLDGDGDVDAVATPSEGPPVLLRNDGSPANGRVLLKLVGSASNRAGLGARVRWWCSGVERFAEARTGSSYCSASDPRVQLGLGAASELERVEVLWSSGKVSRLEHVPRDHEITVVEGGEGFERRALKAR